MQLLRHTSPITFHWRWRNKTIPRTQDNYTCKENQQCIIANGTVRATNLTGWTGDNNPYHFVFSGPPPTNITITAHVNKSWWQQNSTDFYKRPGLNWKQPHQWVNMTIGHPAAYNHIFSVQTSQFILCSNATPIENRTIWGDFLWLSVAWPQNNTSQLVRVPRTCSNVSVAARKHLIHFHISFPELPDCNRRRRAWYDTLLGGLGSGFGIANSIDLED